MKFKLWSNGNVSIDFDTRNPESEQKAICKHNEMLEQGYRVYQTITGLFNHTIVMIKG